ncbi:Uu.00g117370.m01.CDS01 [Anthostomella pinea]|uniref:Uu.00g117370.m01.CDS01 n=1 Tax=Anthostomella pinea TaxID=933095 RepID=A0AAI8VG40_9PEZI|nr:Uu.00g117370.m01.CDS01 [Anthostomella pinea]
MKKPNIPRAKSTAELIVSAAATVAKPAAEQVDRDRDKAICHVKETDEVHESDIRATDTKEAAVQEEYTELGKGLVDHEQRPNGVGGYEHLMLRDEDTISTYHGSGTARSLMSNQVSYFFDWQGPSMTIDTACSSSLVAVHQAVRQLRSGESRVAVVTGVNLILDPQFFISFSKLQMLSSEGRSRMWDDKASGYGRGEGIAAVVLKTLNAAEADGDHIECIIRETRVNQDGKTPSITVPSSTAQSSLIRRCYARAGLDLANAADRPQYFEAHGTGTLAGDPVEAEAISSAFFPVSKPSLNGAQPLLVGSIKTVIGHTEGTAGLHFFGFGGTNAHAILENYESAESLSSSPPDESPNFLPLVFSAASESSLLAYLDAFCVYLRGGPTLSLRNLAYTLESCRTSFQISTSVAARTVEDLCTKLEGKIQGARSNADELAGHRSMFRLPDHKPRIIGIFTGQGAQWPRQGSDLIENSPTAYRTLEALELRLARLPPQDRPTWSLIEELQKEPSSSLVHQAELSQPLCTAIQILQVDVLRAAGVVLCDVVGHSSGEIAAAYAAGRISAEDAICIAYYRGRYSNMAQGSRGQPGAMMAVSTSLEDIQELCEFPDFKGRICVAAVNSKASITVSGDKDSIEKLQDILHDENKSAKMLKVDTAYHSHHMLPCSDPYLAALEALQIRVRASNGCRWFSSVSEGDMASIQDALEGEYWNSNLCKPVLFLQAVRLACRAQGPFDFAVELGPHPALKGPALQNIIDASDSKLQVDIPYAGLFHRGKGAIETVAEALGCIWSHLGECSVDFGSYDRFVSGLADKRQRLVKGLPTYAWDHSHEYWHEPRYAKAQRSRPDPVHSLLGHRTPDSTGTDIRWRQILHPKEIPWLNGHRLQGQIVFPAAGYVVLALEAALSICQDTAVRLIDVAKLEILKAMTFDEENTGVEAVFSLSDISPRSGRLIDASFRYHASDERRGDSLSLLASGRIRVTLGESAPASLPSRSSRQTHLYPVEVDDFYASLRDLGYQYSPPFTGLSHIERRLAASTGFIANVQTADLLIHPAVLDAAFQSIFLAQSFPNDGGIWALHVPKRIRNIRVNPGLCAETAKSALLPFDSVQPENGAPFSGDVDIYADSIGHAMIQVEGLTPNWQSVPLATTAARDDKEMFATTTWSVAVPDARLALQEGMVTPEHRELACTLERSAIFYLRRLDHAYPSDHPARSEGPITGIFQYASHVLASARESKLPYWKPEWEFDTFEQISMACQRYSDTAEVELLQVIGNDLVEIANGEKQALEFGMENHLLERYYTQAPDISVFTKYLATIIGQITHRYPHVHALEVGAGTGAATREILQGNEHVFASYTFTDISSGFFGRASEVLSGQHSRMAFKILDIDSDPCSQGFSEHSRLLRPGGYLVLEGLPDTAIRLGAIFGAFLGWWAGSNDNRTLSPFVSPSRWDQLLRAAEFSGCDTVTENPDLLAMPLSVFVSQAVDNRILFLRDPVSLFREQFGPGDLIKTLVLVGGKSLRTSRLIAELQTLARPFCQNVMLVLSLPHMSSLLFNSDATIVSLTDIDEPLFKNPSEAAWEALKAALLKAKSLLWVTHARDSKNPHASMILGFLRSSLREIPTLDFQSLDIEDAQQIKAQLIFESILRLNAIKAWQREGTTSDMLITAEPEVKLSEDGHAMIPRLQMNRRMNNRYNSSRRIITFKARPDSQTVIVASSDSGYHLHLRLRSIGPPKSDCLRVSHSFLTAVKVSETSCMFLVIGVGCESGEQQVALSDLHGSLIRPGIHLSVPVTVPSGLEPALITNIAHTLAVSVVLRGLVEGDHVLVYEPPAAFAAILAETAALVNVHVTFVSCRPRSGAHNWRTIHPYAPGRLLSLLPLEKFAVFVDFIGDSENRFLSDHIHSLLSPNCRHEKEQTLFSNRSWVPRDSDLKDIRTQLQKAIATAEAHCASLGPSDFRTIAPSDISDLRTDPAPLVTIDWTRELQTSIKVQPADSERLFKGSKTYWLAGLGGGLGLSLCEWMVRHGAKHVVLSSRQPSIDDSWRSKMSAAGAMIRVFSCVRKATLPICKTLHALYTKICSSMPPIGGVAQGAMVLEDALIRDMTFSPLRDATLPKVDGSCILNDLLRDCTLEFFVFFSSASAVVGNPGQSNYSAANLFMSSLAEQRRRHGQAASVINIGPILGVGYVTQQGIDIKVQVQAESQMFISEHDFHQLFAEAVLAGTPGSCGPIEITSGVARVNHSQRSQPAWASNPVMSQFIRFDEPIDLNTAVSQQDVPVRTQLEEARTKIDVLGIIAEALIPKLCVLFQLQTEDLARENLSNLHLNAMGTDSLLAIDIRSWFMAIFQANIPVLKILGGASVGELIEMAAEAIPLSMLPKMRADSDDSSMLATSASEVEGPSNPSKGHSDSEPQNGSSGSHETRPTSTTSSQDHFDRSQDIVASGPYLQQTAKLSFSQSMFWFVLMFLSDKAGLNHTGSFRLRGRINPGRFEMALQAIGYQHESLRTFFFEKSGQPMQGIMDSSTLRAEYRQISSEDDVAKAVEELQHHVFDLAHGETMRIMLLYQSPTIQYLVLGTHSLIVDGWPLTTPSSFKYSDRQYVDFAHGQFDGELTFWKSELAELPPPLPILRLGRAVSRPPLTLYDNERAFIRFKPDPKGRIQTLCRSCKVTPFHFYLAVFRVLLLRYADAGDVSVGIADANRNDEETINSIGSFVNLLPLSFHANANTKFHVLLEETRDKVFAAMANSRVPFQVLLNELDIPRSATHTPIFQSFVDYRLGQRELTQWADCQLEMQSFHVSKLAYDVALDIIDDPDGDCQVALIVRRDLYSEQDAGYLAKSFRIMVEAFSKDAEMEIIRAPIYDHTDVSRVTAFGQGPRHKSSWPETILHRICDVAECLSTELAVDWMDGSSVTYAELLVRTASVANALKNAAVQFGQRVAVLQAPTPDWIASVLAIMQVGAVYVPFDLGNPWSRLAALMRDCQPSVILVDDETQQHTERLGVTVLTIINVVGLELNASIRLPISATAPGTAAILYTSGSSGIPKGIMLKHKGLRNWLEHTAQVYELGSERVLQQSSSGFDMSLIQIFTALCFGGCICLVPRRHRGDAVAISDLIYARRVTYTFCCTSELVTWLKYGNPVQLSRSAWRRAITGGEPGVGELLRDFAELEKGDLRLYHAYGPTETSFTAATMELLYNDRNQEWASGNVAVGYTLPNYTVYILDEYADLVPPGVQGEVCIGGPGVAAGYLSREELNRERFIPNVMASKNDLGRDWNTIHRTGDLGRWGETGALFIEGRISGDTQIKLRGLRIDLREVEHALLETAQGQLGEAVVSCCRMSASDPEFLVAHVVFNQIVSEDKWSQVATSLPPRLDIPRYMCPGIVVPVTSLPRTNTGKLDRRAVAALPLPNISVREVGLSRTETLLGSIWSDIIPGNMANTNRITPSTDFFHIGGTSLLLLELRRRVRADFDTELSLISMFDMSTLEAMASAIEGRGEHQSSSVVVDWEHEAGLTLAIAHAGHLQHVVHADSKTVVLTGSTGYLGSAILDALIEDPLIKSVYCIAVRDVGRRHIPEHSKVTFYEGDLLRGRLGLSEQDAKRIFHEADMIIHNGADVSYGKTWASLRLCNLQATKELVEMSLPRLVPFHYISSGGACSFAAAAGCHEIGPVSVAQYPPPSTVAPGYAASKWASEVFLEKVHAHHPGWPIYIHRPSNIARAGEPHLDLIHNLRHFSRVMRAVPVARGSARGAIDSVDLGEVVRGIMGAIHPPDGEEEHGRDEKLRFLHHAGGDHLPLDDMRAWVAETGMGAADSEECRPRSEVEQLPFADWARRGGEHGMDPVVVAFLQAFENRGEMVFPRLMGEVIVDRSM